MGILAKISLSCVPFKVLRMCNDIDKFISWQKTIGDCAVRILNTRVNSVIGNH